MTSPSDSGAPRPSLGRPLSNASRPLPYSTWWRSGAAVGRKNRWRPSDDQLAETTAVAEAALKAKVESAAMARRANLALALAAVATLLATSGIAAIGLLIAR